MGKCTPYWFNNVHTKQALFGSEALIIDNYDSFLKGNMNTSYHTVNQGVAHIGNLQSISSSQSQQGNVISTHALLGALAMISCGSQW